MVAMVGRYSGASEIVDRAAVGRPISNISLRNGTNLNSLVSWGLWATQFCFSLNNSLLVCAKPKLYQLHGHTHPTLFKFYTIVSILDVRHKSWLISTDTPKLEEAGDLPK